MTSSIRKFDTVSRRQEAACQKLLVDPRRVLQFKTGCRQGQPRRRCRHRELRRHQARRHPPPRTTSRSSSPPTPRKRKVQIARDAGLRSTATRASPAERRTSASAPRWATERRQVRSEGSDARAGRRPAGIDWQWASSTASSSFAQKIDNTGAPNEPHQVLDCRFENNARLQCHTCDTPVIARNRFGAGRTYRAGDSMKSTRRSPRSRATVSRQVLGRHRLRYQSDTTIADNADRWLRDSIQGYAVPATMMRSLVLKNSECASASTPAATRHRGRRHRHDRSRRPAPAPQMPAHERHAQEPRSQGIGLETSAPVSLAQLHADARADQDRRRRQGPHVPALSCGGSADARPARWSRCARSIRSGPRRRPTRTSAIRPSPVIMGKTPSPMSRRRWCKRGRSTKRGEDRARPKVARRARPRQGRRDAARFADDDVRPMEASYRAPMTNPEPQGAAERRDAAH